VHLRGPGPAGAPAVAAPQPSGLFCDRRGAHTLNVWVEDLGVLAALTCRCFRVTWTTDMVVEVTENADAPAAGPAPSVIAELRRRGVTIAVCSNWDWDLDRVLDEAGLTQLVDMAVTSARAGVRKPHPLIFHSALQLAGVGPGEALLVGDSWEADVEGARLAGIPPVHVWREPSDPPPLVDGVRRIPDLRGLLDLV